LRFAPDVSVRVATETVGGRKVEQNLHRFRTPCCTPTVRLNLDLALPDWRDRDALARIEGGLKGAAWDITWRIRAQHPTRMRVYVRKSSYGMKQSINQSINQQERNNNSWHPAAGANQFEAIQSAESNTISIELVPHAHRRLNPHLAPLH